MTLQSNVYSHGLEAIYTLETVDIRSVRTMRSEAPQPLQKALKKEKPLPPQLELDYGAGFRNWIPPFFPDEPLHFLGINKQAERVLAEKGIRRIGDLLKVDLSRLAFIKGFGQAYLDELRTLLPQYIQGKNACKAFAIDAAAWIRSLTGSCDRKKIYLLLEEYSLGSLMALSPLELLEVKRLPAERRREWISDSRAHLLAHGGRQTVITAAGSICDAFLKPWVAMRRGLASRAELQERLIRASEDGEAAQKAFGFIRDLYFNGSDPFLQGFVEVDTGVFALDTAAAGSYNAVAAKADSYFYTAKVSYRLSHLESLIAREFAREWIGFPDGFIEKALRLSPRYRVCKGRCGSLLVHLS